MPLLRRFSLFPWFAVGLLVAPALGAGTAAQPPAAQTMIILDASGSMVASIGGQTRIAVARQVVDNLVAHWDASQPLGLMAYGHRRKNDCSDIEVLAPVGAIDRVALTAEVDKLTPKGMTPLGTSLQHAAAALGSTPGSKRIVLVTDGIEDCHSDPCAIAKALHDAQADLKIEVVGLKTDTGHDEQLKCIAENGDGAYYPADDAPSLVTALNDAVTATPPPPEPVPPPAPPAPQPPTSVRYAPVAFDATETKGGAAIVDPLEWTITLKGNNSVAYAGGGAEVAPELDTGTYEVTVRGDNATASAEIDVRADPGERHALILPVGRLALAAVTATGQPEIEGDGALSWSIAPLAAQAAPVVPLGAKPTLLLAPGRYKVSVTTNGITTNRLVTVAAGRNDRQVLDLKLGTLVLEAAISSDGPAITDWHAAKWSLMAAQNAAPLALDPTALSDARPSVLLPAGHYSVGLGLYGATLSESADVTEGQTVVHRVVLPTADLQLTAALGPDSAPYTDWHDVQWTVEAIDALGAQPGDRAADAEATAELDLQLAAGQWRVSVTSGSAASSQTLTLGPGAKQATRIDLGAARLTLNATIPDGATPFTNVVYTVSPLHDDGSTGDSVYEGGSNDGVSTIVPAGRWHIGAVDNQGRAETTTVDLAIGQELSLTLPLSQ